MPKKGRVPGPEFVSQVHGIIQDIPEDSPWQLLSRPTERAAMNSFRFRPESTAASISEELTGFDVHPFAFAAGAKGEDKSDQLLARELACAGEILG